MKPETKEIKDLKISTSSKFKNEALIKKRIFDYQDKNGFETTFDFMLEELDSLISEVINSTKN